MKEINFKGLKGLVLENETYSVIILPELGAKIASFYNKRAKFELMYQNQDDVYKLPNPFDSFGDYDTSGFDDCFPNIDVSSAKYGEKTIEYPDHGEIWYAPFDYSYESDSLELTYKSQILPYTYKKTVCLNEDGLNINYCITNYGDYPIEGFYTVHCLTICEDDMIFMFPKEVTMVENVANPSTILGAGESVHPYPITKDLNGKDYYLNRTAGASANKCEKYYATEPIKAGKCGIHYNSIDEFFIMEYDAAKLPYLGLWLNENGFNNDYNCALEPSNGYYDSLERARKNNRSYTIAPKDLFCFSLNLKMSKTY